MKVSKDKSNISSSSVGSQSATSDQTAATVVKMQKSNMKSIKAFYTPAKLSEQEENALNLAFLRAVISGGVPFNFVDNYYFSEWVQMLKFSYNLLSRTTLTNNHLVQLYIEACDERDVALKEASCCTCLWNGWTEVSHQSIYALMLLHDESSELLDVVNLSKEQHTAQNMLTFAINIFNKSALKDQTLTVKCLTTDSPRVMLNFRRIMAEYYSHMLTLPCALHVANIFCKDVCKID